MLMLLLLPIDAAPVRWLFRCCSSLPLFLCGCCRFDAADGGLVPEKLLFCVVANTERFDRHRRAMITAPVLRFIVFVCVVSLALALLPFAGAAVAVSLALLPFR